MSYRNKLILAAVISFAIGLRFGSTGAHSEVVEASVNVYERLTGQGRGLF